MQLYFSLMRQSGFGQPWLRSMSRRETSLKGLASVHRVEDDSPSGPRWHNPRGHLYGTQREQGSLDPCDMALSPTTSSVTGKGKEGGEETKCFPFKTRSGNRTSHFCLQTTHHRFGPWPGLDGLLLVAVEGGKGFGHHHPLSLILFFGNTLCGDSF